MGVVAGGHAVGGWAGGDGAGGGGDYGEGDFVGVGCLFGGGVGVVSGWVGVRLGVGMGMGLVTRKKISRGPKMSRGSKPGKAIWGWVSGCLVIREVGISGNGLTIPRDSVRRLLNSVLESVLFWADEVMGRRARSS